MTYHQIFNQVVEVVGPTLIESPYSDHPVEDWDNPVFTLVNFPVSVQPAGSTEGAVERPQTVETFRMFTPPGTDIPELKASHKIRLGGVLFLELVGQPERWPDPHNPGEVHHLEAVLEVVRG